MLKQACFQPPPSGAFPSTRCACGLLRRKRLICGDGNPSLEMQAYVSKCVNFTVVNKYVRLGAEAQRQADCTVVALQEADSTLKELYANSLLQLEEDVQKWDYSPQPFILR